MNYSGVQDASQQAMYLLALSNNYSWQDLWSSVASQYEDHFANINICIHEFQDHIAYQLHSSMTMESLSQVVELSG